MTNRNYAIYRIIRNENYNQVMSVENSGIIKLAVMDSSLYLESEIKKSKKSLKSKKKTYFFNFF